MTHSTQPKSLVDETRARINALTDYCLWPKGKDDLAIICAALLKAVEALDWMDGHTTLTVNGHQSCVKAAITALRAALNKGDG